AVAAGDTDEREDQDDRHAHRLVVPQHSEVDDHDDADEDLEQQDELALRLQIGLARLVDELGDLLHRAMNREILELDVDDGAEEQAEHADDEAEGQQRLAIDSAEKRDGAQVGASAGWPAIFDSCAATAGLLDGCDSCATTAPATQTTTAARTSKRMIQDFIVPPLSCFGDPVPTRVTRGRALRARG